jgi:hypothetical protein
MVLVLLSGCAVGRGVKKGWDDFMGASFYFPDPKPGLVIINNTEPIYREIMIFRGSYSLKKLKAVSRASGNEKIVAPPLKLYHLSGKYLVFKSEDSFFGPGRHPIIKFTIPYGILVGGDKIGQAAFLYLRPKSKYTLYVRDYSSAGSFLGERTIRIRTGESADEFRRTFLGPIWADEIIDLPRPRARARGIDRLGVQIKTNP